MSVQLELREVILLGLAWLGFVFAAGKILLAQADRRQDERFAAMEKSRKEAQEHWDRQFAALASQNQAEAAGWKQLERDFMGWKAELPIQYVRREDYVRNQTVIEAKLDGLALRIENQYLKGNQHV